MKKSLFVLFLVLTSVPVMAQGPQVLLTNPVSQSMVTAPNHTISVSFDQSIDQATVNQNTFRVSGRWSGPMDGTFNFDTNATIKFIPLRDFFYGEWITVSMSSEIQNNNGDALVGGYSFNYWTKSLPASLDLEFGGQIEMREPGEGAITCYGAYAGDVNNDEFSDLVVITEDSDDIRILLSDGNLGYEPFVIIEMPAGQGPSTNEGADFNQDGFIDMAIGSTYSNTINVLKGDPVTYFSDQTSYVSDDGVRGLAVGDFNGDGWDDIVTANRTASNIALFFNDGTGAFEPAVYILSGFAGETSISATDLNSDGYIDLIVSTYSSDRLISLLNDGSGNFTTNATADLGDGPWMQAIGDVNGDGFVDVATANSLSDDISIVMSDGTGGFVPGTNYPTNKFPVAIDLGDIDGDGDLDFISSNVIGGDYLLMENDGSGNFINPRVYPSADQSSCATIHDRNNDGAMDITMIDEAADVVLLYNNSLTLGNDELEIKDRLEITPNPFDNRIFINGNIVGPVALKLYDLHGRQLISQTIEISKQFEIRNLGLPDGMYIAQLFHNGSSQNFTLIKKSR